MPLIVRAIPGDLATAAGFGSATLRDATGPRGYPGPLLAAAPGVADEALLARAVPRFAAALAEDGIVAAFVRLHPFLSPPSAALARWGTVVEHGESTSIDLRLTPEELWGQTNHGHRQGINKARRRGFVARIDESWDHFDGFVTAFQATMRRLEAASFWHLGRDYFADLRAALGERMHLCVVERDGDLASASLLTEVDGVVEYHLSGTVDAYLRDSPSKLLVDFARSWARSRGNRVLHLGGSLRPGDPLSQFKAGFSPNQHVVASWRLIADADRYEALTRAWAARSGRPADGPEGSFPAYRNPSAGRLPAPAAAVARR